MKILSPVRLSSLTHTTYWSLEVKHMVAFELINQWTLWDKMSKKGWAPCWAS